MKTLAYIGSIFSIKNGQKPSFACIYKQNWQKRPKNSKKEVKIGKKEVKIGKKW